MDTNSVKKPAILRWLNALSFTHKHTYTDPHTTSSSGRQRILFNRIMFLGVFLLLSLFPQTPWLPCQEDNESTKPFVMRSAQHPHYCLPHIPENNSHLPIVISALSHSHPALLLPGLTAHPASGSNSTAAVFFLAFFFFFSNTVMMC